MLQLSRRRISAAIFAVSVAVVIAACGSSSSGSSGGSSGGSSSGSGGTTGSVSFLTYSAENQVWGPIIADFAKAYPKVTVTHETQDPTTYPVLLGSRIQAGNAPNVFRVIGGLGFNDAVQTLAPNGQLKDLSGEPWASSLPTYASAPFTYQGKLYGLPLAISLQDVLWDGGLMKKLGLGIPSTFSQLLNVCSVAKSKGLVAIAVTGPAAATFAGEVAADTVYANQPNWNTLRVENKVTFASSPGWNQALTEFSQMKTAGCFSPDAVSASIIQAIGSWVSGKALSFPAPSFAQAAAPKMNVIQAPFPAVDPANTRVVEYDGQAIAVSKSAPAAATNLLNFIAKPGEEAKFVSTQAGSVTITDVEKKVYPANWAQYIEPLLSANKYTFTPSQDWKSPNVANDLSKAVQAVLSGGESAKAALAAMDQAWTS